MQEYVSRVERILQSFALLARSTSVSVTGKTFEGFFKEKPSPAAQVWAAFLNPPPGLAKDFIVSPTCREVTLEHDALLTFHVNERMVSIERDLKRLLATGIVSLHEMHAEDFLGDPAHSAHRVAERVVHHSVYMCAVLLMPFEAKREAAIRAAIEKQLAANGSKNAAQQAAACPIVAACGLPLLIDSQRHNLVVDSAHRLGSAEHGQWVSWATPLRERGVLKSVDLVAAADLATTRAGFCTVHELSVLSRNDENSLRLFARSILDARLGGGTRQLRVGMKKLNGTVQSALKVLQGGARRLFMVSRLAHSIERSENVTFIKTHLTFPDGTFRHCALLGSDEFALEMARQVDVLNSPAVTVLREEVAGRFNLRDWISFLAALPREKALVVVVGESELGDNISSYIQRARLPRKPELTTPCFQ